MPTFDRNQTIELTRAFVAPHRVAVWDASGTQLIIGKRKGYRLWDVDGREYIDLHINGGTYNLGHRNPELVAVLVDALAELDIGNHHFASPLRAQLGERLAQLTPGAPGLAVFASSGSEAVDIAIKTARAATGRRGILAMDAAYHGRTGLSGAAGDPTSAKYFLSDHPDEFAVTSFGDLAAIESALSTERFAAAIFETVPASYGFPVAPAGFYRRIKELCAEYGSLYIADEVQTGLGRTGELWGVEAAGLDPDMLVTAKGLSGGLYPIAATVIASEHAGWLRENGWGHVSTFGGSELGCVVALSVLERTIAPATRAHVDWLIGRLATDLRSIQADEPFLTDIRQTGLVIGLQVGSPTGAVHLQRELFELGVWAIASGFDRSVLQFKPGLLLDAGTLDSVLERLIIGLARAKRSKRLVPARHPQVPDEGT